MRNRAMLSPRSSPVRAYSKSQSKSKAMKRKPEKPPVPLVSLHLFTLFELCVQLMEKICISAASSCVAEWQTEFLDQSDALVEN